MGREVDRGGPEEPRLDSRREARRRPQQRWRPLQPQPVLGEHGPGRRRGPGGDLGAAIDQAFGSFDDLKTKVNDAGANQFGSGWAWLVWDGSGLAVESSPNQDTPLSSGKTPLLGVDVWEHAYYLKYQNRRPEYLNAWWNTINWAKVAERYAAVKRYGRGGRRAGRDGAGTLRRPAAAQRHDPAERDHAPADRADPGHHGADPGRLRRPRAVGRRGLRDRRGDRQPGRLAGPLAQLGRACRARSSTRWPTSCS